MATTQDNFVPGGTDWKLALTADKEARAYSGVGDGADCMVHAPEALADETVFDYTVFLAGEQIVEENVHVPVNTKWQIRFTGNMTNPGYCRWRPYINFLSWGRRALFPRPADDALDPYPDTEYYANPKAPPVVVWDTAYLRERLYAAFQKYGAAKYPEYQGGIVRRWVRPAILNDLEFWTVDLIPPFDPDDVNSYVLHYVDEFSDLTPDLNIHPNPRYCLAWSNVGDDNYYPIPEVLRKKYVLISEVFRQALIDYLQVPHADTYDHSRKSKMTFGMVAGGTPPLVFSNIIAYHDTDWHQDYSVPQEDWYTYDDPNRERILNLSVDGMSASGAQWAVNAEGGLYTLIDDMDPLNQSPNVFTVKFRVNYENLPAEVIEDGDVILTVEHSPEEESYAAWDVTFTTRDASGDPVETWMEDFDPNGGGTTTWTIPKSRFVGVKEVEIEFLVDPARIAMIYDWEENERRYDTAGYYDGPTPEDTLWVKSVEMTVTNAEARITPNDPDLMFIEAVAEYAGSLYDSSVTNPSPDYDASAMMAAGFEYSTRDNRNIIATAEVPTSDGGVEVVSALTSTELHVVATTESTAPLTEPYFVAFPWNFPIVSDPLAPENWHEGPKVNISMRAEKDLPAEAQIDTIDRRFVGPGQNIQLVLHSTEGAIAIDGVDMTAMGMNVIVPTSPATPDHVHTRQEGDQMYEDYHTNTESGFWLQWFGPDDNTTSFDYDRHLILRAASAYSKDMTLSRPWRSQSLFSVLDQVVKRDITYKSDFQLRDLNAAKITDRTQNPLTYTGWTGINPDMTDPTNAVVIEVNGKYLLKGGAGGAPPLFDVESVWPGVASDDPAIAKEGVTNLRWEVADNSPYVDTYLIQDPVSGDWTIAANMNLNMEMLWYPRFSSGYYYIGQQEFYLFGDEQKEQTLGGSSGMGRSTFAGSRYGAVDTDLDLRHFVTELQFVPQQSAPIIVMAGHAMDEGTATMGFPVGYTRGRGQLMNTPSLTTVSSVLAAVPDSVRPGRGAVVSDKNMYLIMEQGSEDKWGVYRCPISSWALPLDDAMEDLLQTLPDEQDDRQLFLARDYYGEDFSVDSPSFLVSFDPTLLGAEYNLDAIAVSGDTLYCAISKEDGGDYTHKVYQYSIGIQTASAGVDKAWKPEEDPSINLTGIVRDQKISGIYADGDTIFITNNNNPDGLTFDGDKQILVVNMMGQHVSTIQISLNQGATSDAIIRLGGITMYKDFFIVAAEMESSSGFTGWHLLQIDSYGDVITVNAYPTSADAAPDEEYVYVTVYNDDVIVRDFYDGQFGLRALRIDAEQAPTLLPVFRTNDTEDPAGISRVETFERNKYHLYPLQYSNVVIESIIIDGIELVRIDTYHDQTKVVQGQALRGPLYRVDPNQTIFLNESEVDRFDFYYKWLFDFSDYLDMVSLVNGAPTLSDMDLVSINDWGVQDSMRIGSRGLDRNTVYLETPEDIQQITIRYMVKRSFSPFTINRLQSEVASPDSGLYLVTSLAFAEEGTYRVFYEKGIDPYFHLAPPEQVDPGKNIIDTISFNPALAVENTGFVYIDDTDREIASIEVGVEPSTIVGTRSNVVGTEHILYWYAILRDKYGAPVPNRAVHVRLEGLVKLPDQPSEENHDIPHSAIFAHGNISNFMGKVCGTLTVPQQIEGGYIIDSTRPLQFVVEYMPLGEWNKTETAPAVYGGAEIWVE